MIQEVLIFKWDHLCWGLILLLWIFVDFIVFRVSFQFTGSLCAYSVYYCFVVILLQVFGVLVCIIVGLLVSSFLFF